MSEMRFGVVLCDLMRSGGTALVCAALLLGGCAGTGESTDVAAQRAGNAGTTTPGTGESQDGYEAKMREIAAAMDARRTEQATPRSVTAPGAAWDFTREQPREMAEQPRISAGSTEVTVEDPIPETPASRGVGEPAYVPTPSESQSRLVHELAGVLQRRIAEAQDVPMDLLVRLAALDAVEPGVFNTYFPEGRGGSALLTEDELAFLVQWRDMLESVRATADEGSSSVVRTLIERIDEGARELTELDDLRIRTALLCRRVEAIGRYDELDRYGDTYKMVAGASGGHRAIVYVEPFRFSNEPASRKGVPGYAVEIEQDLLLYRLDEQADMLAWQFLDQTVSEFSTVKRQDFFLTCVVNLPPTLSVGKYRLKVVLRDRHTGAVAEETINLEMVGNAAALRE